MLVINAEDLNPQLASLITCSISVFVMAVFCRRTEPQRNSGFTPPSRLGDACSCGCRCPSSLRHGPTRSSTPLTQNCSFYRKNVSAPPAEPSSPHGLASLEAPPIEGRFLPLRALVSDPSFLGWIPLPPALVLCSLGPKSFNLSPLPGSVRCRLMRCVSFFYLIYVSNIWGV